MALNNSNAIVGLEENALPLVKRVANELHLKPALMRNSDSAGKNWRLDTTTLSGNPKSIVLIDDTITTGKALKAVVSALNGSKYHVCGIVVLVNFGKVKRIGGLPVHSIL
jgi:orotate phosphoribosyltransferase-like protein